MVNHIHVPSTSSLLMNFSQQGFKTLQTAMETLESHTYLESASINIKRQNKKC